MAPPPPPPPPLPPNPGSSSSNSNNPNMNREPRHNTKRPFSGYRGGHRGGHHRGSNYHRGGHYRGGRGGRFHPSHTDSHNHKNGMPMSGYRNRFPPFPSITAASSMNTGQNHMNMFGYQSNNASGYHHLNKNMNVNVNGMMRYPTTIAAATATAVMNPMAMSSRRHPLPGALPIGMIPPPPPPLSSGFNHPIHQRQQHHQHLTSHAPPLPPSVMLQPPGNQRIHQQMPYLNPQQQQQQSLNTSLTKSPWSEHTNPATGSKYYYNSITMESTHECPPEFLANKSNVSSNNNTSVEHVAKKQKSNQHNGITQSQATLQNREWKVYVEAKSGKQYYSNGVTSTWEKPANYHDEDEDNSQDNSVTDINGDSIERNESQIVYESKGKAIEAFINLLKDKGIGSNAKWQEVVKSCTNDNRWEAVNTKSERKQILAEYQGKCLKEEREKKRTLEKRARDRFHELLSETNNIGIQARYSDFRGKLSMDERFSNVQNEDLREEYFYDFADELEKKSIRERRVAHKLAYDNFMLFLKANNVSHLSTWRTFYASLKKEQRENPHFTSMESDHEKQRYFADYVAYLRDENDEARRTLKSTEAADKDRFRKLLLNMSGNGTIKLSTTWDDIKDIVEADSSFIDLNKHGEKILQSVFDDYMKDLSYTYRRDRAFISHIVSTNAVSVTDNVSFDAFCSLLKSKSGQALERECKKVLERKSIASAKICYDELLASEDNILTREEEEKTLSIGNDNDDEGEVSEEGELSEEGEIEDENDDPTTVIGKRQLLE